MAKHKNPPAAKQKAKAKTPRSRASARERRKRSLAWRRILFTLLVLAIVIGTIFFLFVRRGEQVSIAENGVGSIFTPIQRGFTACVDFVKDFFTDWRSYDKLEAENAQLARENQQLTLELASMEEIELENARLLSLLEAGSTYDSLNPKFARVIGRDGSSWFDTFTIDLGSQDDIKPGMAVVTGDGLVGRVYEVGLNYSKVISVIDARSSTSILVQRTRDNGVMQGQLADGSDSAACRVYYLPNLNNIIPGDIVVTSGTDSQYPKGIVVGTVSAISTNAGAEGTYAEITPMVDFQHIEEVMVLCTVVGSDDDMLPVLTTPQPQTTPTPQPQSSATPEATLAPDTWHYPTATPDMSGLNGLIGDLPEDEWAQN